VDVSVAVDDASLEIADRVDMEASFGYLNDLSEAVVRAKPCARLGATALATFNGRSDLALNHAHACLEIIVRQDGSVETALEVAGENPNGDAADPDNPIEVITRLPVRVVQP
jgi:hypothetical protein